MDIERQNFLKEIEAEIEKQNTPVVVTDKVIDEIYNEAKTKFGSTLENLKD